MNNSLKDDLKKYYIFVREKSRIENNAKMENKVYMTFLGATIIFRYLFSNSVDIWISGLFLFGIAWFVLGLTLLDKEEDSDGYKECTLGLKALVPLFAFYLLLNQVLAFFGLIPLFKDFGFLMIYFNIVMTVVAVFGLTRTVQKFLRWRASDH
jgi:hypothetical protein